MFAFTTTTTERKGGIVITISQRGLEPKKCSSKSVETKGRRLMNEPMGQRRLTYFVRGSIAVRLTSTLTSLDLHKLAKLRLIQVKEDSRIQIKNIISATQCFFPLSENSLGEVSLHGWPLLWLVWIWSNNWICFLLNLQSSLIQSKKEVSRTVILPLMQ